MDPLAEEVDGAAGRAVDTDRVDLDDAPVRGRRPGEIELVELHRDLVAEAVHARAVLEERLSGTGEAPDRRLELCFGLGGHVVGRENDRERVLVGRWPPRVGGQPARGG
jgi:hypothetical protein